MFDYISGKVARKDAAFLVIDVGGVGFKVFADSFTLNQVKTGEAAKIHTYLKVGEDEFTLYGFHQQEQRAMFEKLIGINGIGPKAALSILSSLRVSDIAAAAISNDDKAFTIALGIVKKRAQRIVLEIKEMVVFADAVGDDSVFATGEGSAAAADAVAALAGLGYSRQEALDAVASVKALGDTAEELVALALRRMR
jgi:Holliday junction DNA helicase RuvA